MVFRGRLGVILSNRGKPIGIGIGGFKEEFEVHHIVYHHLVIICSVGRNTDYGRHPPESRWARSSNSVWLARYLNIDLPKDKRILSQCRLPPRLLDYCTRIRRNDIDGLTSSIPQQMG